MKDSTSFWLGSFFIALFVFLVWLAFTPSYKVEYVSAADLMATIEAERDTIEHLRASLRVCNDPIRWYRENRPTQGNRPDLR